MSALYVMRYVGQAGQGAASLYIGRGVILGIDTGACVYRGTYTEQGGGLDGEVRIIAPETGGSLVTGGFLGPSQSIQVGAVLPPDFYNGTTQVIFIGQKTVQVEFEKIGDLP